MTPNTTSAPPMHPATAAILKASAGGRPALIPYVTAGFPRKEDLAAQLRALQPHAAVIEVGVPFSDPMADGATIQHASRRALENGVTPGWIFDELAALKGTLRTPLAMMSYLNPLLTLGLAGLADRCAESGVSLLIIPDLPLEESGELQAALHARGVGLVQLVSPVTPPDRARLLAQHSDGFLYAVTTTGVTGSNRGGAGVPPAALNAYLDALRAVSPVPVAAGFGIRTAEQVRALRGHADAAIVGSALVSAVEAGRDAGEFLASLNASA